MDGPGEDEGPWIITDSTEEAPNGQPARDSEELAYAMLSEDNLESMLHMNFETYLQQPQVVESMARARINLMYEEFSPQPTTPPLHWTDMGVYPDSQLEVEMDVDLEDWQNEQEEQQQEQEQEEPEDEDWNRTPTPRNHSHQPEQDLTPRAVFRSLSIPFAAATTRYDPAIDRHHATVSDETTEEAEANPQAGTRAASPVAPIPWTERCIQCTKELGVGEGPGSRVFTLTQCGCTFCGNCLDNVGQHPRDELDDYVFKCPSLHIPRRRESQDAREIFTLTCGICQESPVDKADDPEFRANLDGRHGRIVTECGHAFCCGCMSMHIAYNPMPFCPHCRAVVSMELEKLTAFYTVLRRPGQFIRRFDY